MTYTVKHFINGNLTEGQSTNFLPIYNPSQGKVIGNVCQGTVKDVDAAVDIAKEMFAEWRTWSALKRARVLFEFKSLLEQHKNQLAELISREHGKVFADALGEVQRGIEVVEFACGAPHLLKGNFSHTIASGMDCYDMRQPLGVCAGITPFNFPAMVPMWMFPIALACGNTFVLKPSEKDPSVSLYIAELLQKSGLPQGVFNIVQGDKLVVDAILKHPDIAAVSFVGSTPIAKYIYETASVHGKRVQALGGAKNHCVVMPDADITQVVQGIMGAAFGSAGERCMAVSVVVAIGNETADHLVEELKKSVTKLVIGPSDHPSSEMGPVISDAHKQKILQYIETGIAQKAKLVVDGRNTHVAGFESGFFLGATVFDHVTADMTIYKEEIFGPVLCIVRVDNLQDAITLINHNPYANGTVIYTQNGAGARYFSQHVHAGMVGINVPIPVPLAFHSFGGFKHSLYGAHHMHGEDGIRFYTRLQTISSRWDHKDFAKQQHFIMPTLE